MNYGIWDVKKREHEAERHYEGMIDGLERQIELKRRAMAIKNAPGFDKMLSAIRDIHKAQQHALSSTNRQLTNDQLRELRGRVHGIADILSLLGSEDYALEQLEALKAAQQNELAEVRKYRPKPKVTS